LVLAACIPARTPPQLAATAASGIVISGDSYDAGAFRVRVPTGWRAITSPAGAAPSVIFASPDNCALIAVSAAPLDAPQPSACADSSATFRRDTRSVTLGGAAVSVGLIAPESAWDAAQVALDQVAGSVTGGASG
jgi:hypothetical protein